MFQTKVAEKSKTHILLSIPFFFEHPTIYETIRENVVDPPRAQVTTWLMLIGCRIPKVTNTYPEYVRKTYFSATARMVTRTPLDVTLYIITCLVIPSDKYFYKLTIIVIIPLLL